jgi:hypothetical protein
MDAVTGTFTVSVTGVAPAPAGTVAGENVAVAPAGSPVTVRSIAAENVSPLAGVRTSEYVALPPGVVVAVVEPPLDGPTVKSSITVTVALPVADEYTDEPAVSGV